MKPNAASDLPWFFGTGPSTAAGDCGLRSSLGGQLAALAEGITRQPTVDASRAEDEMHERMGPGRLIGIIEDRLFTLTPEQVRVLRYHYGERAIDDRVSAAALLCPSAASLVSPRVLSRESLREAVQASVKARDRAWLVVEVEALALVQDAVTAYEAAAVHVPRKVWGA